MTRLSTTHRSGGEHLMAWTQCGHADFQIRLDRNAILLLMMVQYFMGVMQILTAQTPPFCTTVTRTQCAEAADFNLDQLPPWSLPPTVSGTDSFT